MEQQLGLALVQHQQKLEEQQKQLAEQQRVHQRQMAERLAENDKKLRDELAAADRWVDGDAVLASREEIDERRERLEAVSVGPILDKYREGGGGYLDDDLYSDARDEL